MKLSTMIFSDTQEKANRKLKELALNINEEILIHRHNYIETSKQIIHAKWFGDNARGFRYTDVFIDSSLCSNKEAMGQIIMSLIPPYDQRWDESYNRSNHITYF
ncbi:hypothetical protein P9173_09885 [Bacillus safensis]|uniref:hypothetical protein n=1 Tax=Bacillus safensis TaxID=561879 RepID=UPI00227E27C6|nr:hypothetical protein [Bacillus safensis]MCY7542389.1 hypothetical protein [Bacillus safensis]MCY7552852.1 hypothetical protein [Bacillus safensis]MCY7644695.1 hypothetical protein [Bacillus safensis]MCY7655990.1 hypothetical protein [Bacillus safensis]MEC3710465.1 hypothetical protein [Bacillus safensis]